MIGYNIFKFQYSNHSNNDPEYDSIEDAGISADKNVKSIVSHGAQSKPQETDFRNRMVSKIQSAKTAKKYIILYYYRL